MQKEERVKKKKKTKSRVNKVERNGEFASIMHLICAHYDKMHLVSTIDSHIFSLCIQIWQLALLKFDYFCLFVQITTDYDRKR